MDIEHVDENTRYFFSSTPSIILFYLVFINPFCYFKSLTCDEMNINMRFFSFFGTRPLTNAFSAILSNGFQENDRMNYENDDARASLPASRRIATTYFRRRRGCDTKRPTQNGHVLFWITWTHLQCPTRSLVDKRQPLTLAVAESFRGISKKRTRVCIYSDVCEIESNRIDRDGWNNRWWNKAIFNDTLETSTPSENSSLPSHYHLVSSDWI